MSATETTTLSDAEAHALGECLADVFRTADVGDVFTEDLIETWVEWKRKNEVDPIRFRPHPHEFEMYFDI